MKLRLKVSDTDNTMIEVISTNGNNMLWCVVHEDCFEGDVAEALKKDGECEVLLCGPL